MSLFSKKYFQDKIRFDPELVRRVAPDKLVATGLFSTKKEALRAVEIAISIVEEENAGKIP